MADNPGNPTDPGQSPIKDAQMVPLSRLNEVIEERKKLTEQLKAIEDERKAETEKRLIEQSEFKTLAETRGAELLKAQAKAAQIDAYEKTLQEVLASQIASLPEEMRGLVPDELNTSQKLAWLAKNRSILQAPDAFDIGAGKQGGGEKKGVNLSHEEEEVAQAAGMTPEEYARYK